MGSICPKNTFFQLKHYVQRIYLTLLSTTFHCSSYNSPNFSCHFSNKNEFFFQVRITLPYFSSQTLYAFDKRNPSKCKFWDFQLLAWKLTNSLCYFSSHKSVFLKILHRLSVSWHLSNFITEILHFGQKELIKVEIFRLLCALMKVHLNLDVGFD